MPAINATEVAEVLCKGARGEIPVAIVGEGDWPSIYGGDIAYRFGDWEIVFFNDCGELDYTSSVTAPDGRKGEFDDWFGVDGQGDPTDLVHAISADLYRDLQRIIGCEGYLNAGIK